MTREVTVLRLGWTVLLSKRIVSLLENRTPRQLLDTVHRDGLAYACFSEKLSFSDQVGKACQALGRPENYRGFDWVTRERRLSIF